MIYDLFLDKPLQRPRPKLWIKPLLRKEFQSIIREMKFNAALSYQLFQNIQLDIDNFLYLFLHQWLEQDDIIHPVQKLRSDGLPQQIHYITPCSFSHPLFIFFSNSFKIFLDNMTAQVAGHNNDRISEIYHTA